MSARKQESNIDKLGNRNYPRRMTDVFSPEVGRQLTQNYLLSVLPLKESFSSMPRCSLLDGVPDFSVFQAQLKSFGVFTSDLIPACTDIFTIIVNDNGVDPAVRDTCIVYTSKELISLLNPPSRAGRKRRTSGDDDQDCFMFHDNAYMYNPANKAQPGTSTLNNVRHIHHFVADPCTDPSNDLNDPALLETNWFDVQSTALIFVNGGSERTEADREAVGGPVRRKSKRVLYSARESCQVFHTVFAAHTQQQPLIKSSGFFFRTARLLLSISSKKGRPPLVAPVPLLCVR